MNAVQLTERNQFKVKRAIPGAVRRGLRLFWRTQGPWWSWRIQRFWQSHLHQPAPLELCLRLDRGATRSLNRLNPLSPPPNKRKGNALLDRELAGLLAEEDFGGWSPQVEQIDWLQQLLQQLRPRAVLEFGAGRTTVCFCVLLHRIHGPGGFRVLSLDQDAENVQRASSRLKGLPGESCCRIVHTPLTAATVDGRQTAFYDTDAVDRPHFAWLGKADFVFVDGPYADGPCRYGTIPRVRKHLAAGARFIMDDALRGKELHAGALWARENIQVEGVLTLGQGMMVGVVP
jgi:hypothetical protein